MSLSDWIFLTACWWTICWLLYVELIYIPKSRRETCERLRQVAEEIDNFAKRSYHKRTDLILLSKIAKDVAPSLCTDSVQSFFVHKAYWYILKKAFKIEQDAIVRKLDDYRLIDQYFEEVAKIKRKDGGKFGLQILFLIFMQTLRNSHFTVLVMFALLPFFYVLSRLMKINFKNTVFEHANSLERAVYLLTVGFFNQKVDAR